MIEKCNPSHPDKVADRIAGALVDYAYTKQSSPKIAVEVLIGHGKCFIIAETSVDIDFDTVKAVVDRIGGDMEVEYRQMGQDPELASNQEGAIRAGDNGIFKGVPTKSKIAKLSKIARELYAQYPSDGKYVLADRLIVCQSKATKVDLAKSIARLGKFKAVINPLGEWSGGTDVDTGATNRKLGSDMGEAVTGGGLHGKDLSKADVSVNIYAHLKAQETGKTVNLYCAIGDEEIDGVPYEHIVKIAKTYIDEVGGFEKLAEWGIV